MWPIGLGWLIQDVLGGSVRLGYTGKGSGYTYTCHRP